jgi:endo-1,4-beta-xylanase
MAISKNKAHSVAILFHIAVLLFLSLAGCVKPSKTLCNDDEPLSQNADLFVGAAIDHILLTSDSAYRHLFLTHFTSATAENIFKPAYLHPDENTFNWSEANEFIKFCRDNGKRVHGHSLIWHQQNPQWMVDYKGNRAQWDSMMKLHIQSIVRYYKPNVLSWDVVNEAFNEDGSLRNSIWLQHIGPAYIEKAFRYAHEANPEAILFYNDYGLETNPTKRKAIISFLNNLKLRGVPIDGIGLQMHIDIKYSESSLIEEAIQEVAKHHYQLHLSEVDISLNPLGRNYELNQNDLEAQAALMFKIVRAYKNIPSYQQFGITFWGISDNYSWIRSYYNRTDYPLLFDDQYQPKPVYCQFKQAL